jgi:hypothetical protein
MVILYAAIFAAAPAQADELTHKDFEEWANARFGPPDGTPRYWHATGPVRDAASGETLYVFEYYDTIRQIVDPANPNRRVGIARKLDLWRDKSTGELLETFNGKPVQQLPYPYQLFELEYKDGAMEMTVTQGSGAHIRSHRITQTSVERFGKFAHFSTLGHFSLRRPETPGSPLESHTMTSLFIVCEAECGASPRYQWVQSGTSPLFPWAGGDGRKSSFMLMSGARFETYAELPQSLRTVIETKYPQWREPARNMEEVHALQHATK